MDKKINIFKWIFLSIALFFSLLVSFSYASDFDREKDYYKILGVDQNSTTEDIKTAWKSKVQKFHPDKHLDLNKTKLDYMTKKFREAQEAYEILGNPETRAAYDADRLGIITDDILEKGKIENIEIRRNVSISIGVERDFYERLNLSSEDRITDKKVKKQFEKLISHITQEIAHQIEKIPLQQRRGESDILEQKKSIEKLHKIYEAFIALSNDQNRKSYNEAMKNSSKTIPLLGDVFILHSNKNIAQTFLDLNGHPYELTQKGDGRYSLQFSIKPPENRSISDYIPLIRKIFGTNHIDLYTQIEFSLKKIFNTTVETDLKASSQISHQKDKPPLSRTSENTQSTSNLKTIKYPARAEAFSPKNLTHEEALLLLKALSSSSPNSTDQYKIQTTLKRFPREALFFYIAIGATMLTKDYFWNGFVHEGESANPDWMPSFVDHFTSPLGILSFLSFVVAAGQTNRLIEMQLNQLLEIGNKLNSKIRSSTNLENQKKLLMKRKVALKGLKVSLRGLKMPLALTAGMMISNIIHEIGTDESLKICAAGLWSQQTQKTKGYLDNCQTAYIKWSNKGSEWGPSALGLVLSAGTAGIITQLAGVPIKKSRAYIEKLMSKPTIQNKIPNWKITGRLGGRISSFLKMASSNSLMIGVGLWHLIIFFELNTYFFDPYLVQPIQKQLLVSDIVEIESKISSTIKTIVSDDQLDPDECKKIDFEKISWFEGVVATAKNLYPSKKCPHLYINSLIREYESKMDNWRIRQFGEFAYARILWEKSISEVKFIHEYVQFLLKNLETPIDQWDFIYHNIENEYLPSGKITIEDKLQNAISRINQHLEEGSYTCDIESPLILIDEYPYFKKPSKDFFNEKNDNKNLCSIKNLFSNSCQDTLSTEDFFEKCSLTSGSSKCIEEYQQSNNCAPNIVDIKIAAGIKIMNEWINEKYSEDDQYNENIKLLEDPTLIQYNHYSGLSMLTLQLLSPDSTPVSEVLLSIKEELKTNDQNPKSYSTPQFFIVANKSLKRDIKNRADQNTWSENVLFTQFSGRKYPLEEVVLQMVCGESIKNTEMYTFDNEEKKQEQCSTTKEVKNFAENHLPSFDKTKLGFYHFKIPQIFDIPETIKDEICNNTDGNGSAFYKNYTVEGKTYNNLLEVASNYYQDNKSTEKINQQYNLLMECFQIAYKNMYDKKITPVLLDKNSVYKYIKKDDDVNKIKEITPLGYGRIPSYYHKTTTYELPKGTFYSIKNQVEYYFELLKKIHSESLADINTLKDNTIEAMDKYFMDYIQNRNNSSERSDLYTQISDLFYPDGKEFPRGIGSFFDFKSAEELNPDLTKADIIDPIRQADLGELKLKNNKQKATLLVVHRVLLLQERLKQISKEKDIADQIIQ